MERLKSAGQHEIDIMYTIQLHLIF